MLQGYGLLHCLLRLPIVKMESKAKLAAISYFTLTQMA